MSEYYTVLIILFFSFKITHVCFFMIYLKYFISTVNGGHSKKCPELFCPLEGEAN